MMNLFLNKAAFHFKRNELICSGVVLITCGLLCCFYQMLGLSTDGTHSLQRIHWWASDVILNFPKSLLMRKQTYLHPGWPEDEVGFIFWVNHSLKLSTLIPKCVWKQWINQWSHNTVMQKKYCIMMMQYWSYSICIVRVRQILWPHGCRILFSVKPAHNAKGWLKLNGF